MLDYPLIVKTIRPMYLPSLFYINSIAFDLANASNNCTGLIEGTQLLNCPQVEEDIKLCQSKGKKILLSMGGATGSYSLDNEQDGATLADDLWATFGNGGGKARPFGGAVIDGFDLDLEGGGSKGYVNFVNKMRDHFASDKSKKYYISAAPQCPFPDAYLGDVLNSASLDIVSIQFYNNYCSVNNKDQFNYAVWDDWARTKSVNKDVKLYVGVPGSPTAASSGYASIDTMKSTIDSLQKQYPSFAGVMMWDASQAYGNRDGSPHYAAAISQILKSNKKYHRSTSTGPGSTSSSTSSKPSTTKNQPSSTSSTPPSSSPSTPPSHGSPCGDAYKLTCSGRSYAECVYGRWVVRPCAGGLVCRDSATLGAQCGYPETRKHRRRSHFRK
ncbi:Chitinase 1 [Apophysomyces ossiformis]|uniref:chitinase n=1 Tax=Apophysomyces ossiformis TaxID=679940 RepID=A0A8H7BRI6_9FUNG|nr:Chitinase 1 [Apophysomyces ossiformis]